MQNQTGVNEIAGDLLALLLAGFCCVALGIWFYVQPPDVRESVVNGGFALFTLILVQPGIFMTVALLKSSTKLPLRAKLIYASITALIFVFLLPFAITNMVSGWLDSIPK